MAGSPIPRGADDAGHGREPVARLLIGLATLILLAQPFVTTLNELLAAVALRSGLDELLRAWVVPAQVSASAALVRLAGIEALSGDGMIHLRGSQGVVSVLVSWNCVGWQSMLLLLASCVAGLQGQYTAVSKAQGLLIGVVGTLLLTTLRLAAVMLIAVWLGQTAAVVAHDYGGTLLTLLWLWAFWWFVGGFVLEPRPAG